MFKRKGFSLVEILVALSVIIALGTGASLVSSHMTQIGMRNSAMSGAAAIAVAVNQYALDMGTYPSSIRALTVRNGSKGPWMSATVNLDPWNNAYEYVYDNTNKKFAVWSKGPNRISNSNLGSGACGGDDIGVYSR